MGAVGRHLGSDQRPAAHGSAGDATIVGHIAELNLFPLKSMRPLRVQAARATPSGLALADVQDREFMLIDATSNAVTQRMLPRLATVVVEADDDDAVLLLRAPEQPAALPVSLTAEGQPAVTARLYAQELPCLDMGDEAAAWFTALLAADTPTNGSAHPPFRLVRLESSHVRKCADSVLSQLVDRPAAASDAAKLSDYGPILLTTSGSLAALNSSLPPTAAIPMDRFRPNVVIDTTGHAEAWAEDGWVRLRAGAGVEIRAISRCPRCVIPTINQATGEAAFRAALEEGDEGLASGTAEPLPTMKATRSLSPKLGAIGAMPVESGGVGEGLSPLFGVCESPRLPQSFAV